MKNSIHDILIIGAGLSGLTLAYLLRNKGLNVKIIEARGRIGGRIYTKEKKDTASIELGATWFGKQHAHLLNLLKELDISFFVQQYGVNAIYEPFSTEPHQLVSLPQGGESTYRIAGGTNSILSCLLENLNNDIISFNETVTKIVYDENEIITLETNHNNFKAKKVVSTIPPNLLVNSISFSPELSENFRSIAKRTQTWMGESIKIGFTYTTPFWREKGNSGTIFSNSGPIVEMYDHSNIEDNLYALKGFMNGAYFSLSKEERMEIVLNQLKKYYGSNATNFISYEEMVWQKETHTYTPYKSPLMPHENNGNNIYLKSYFNHTLYFAGAETVPQFPGYMDAAVASANRVFSELY